MIGLVFPERILNKGNHPKFVRFFLQKDGGNKYVEKLLQRVVDELKFPLAVGVNLWKTVIGFPLRIVV